MLGAEAEAIEYAVKMRRFDTRAGFDRLLADGRLEPGHVTDLGRRLAELHRIAAMASADSGFGSFEDVSGPLRDNFEDLGKTLKRDAFRQRLDELNRWTERQLARLTPLLEKRRR
ncbi:hypothetical protein IU462_30235, partial [Nocardia farcinica]|uniref:hypothetical protein n=1 Tax=Nocardia farcinica TaxID=37329 RepID=UPI001E2C0B9A